LPETSVFFYQDKEGQALVVEWLKKLSKQNKKAWANCRARIKQLTDSGHELRRPAADTLRDGIYELRAKQGKVQYRILYFFHGQNIAVLAHSIIKKGSAVPDTDINKAIERKEIFEKAPEEHTYQEEEDDD